MVKGKFNLKGKLNGTDIAFGIVLLLGVVFLGFFIYGAPYSQDEPFYLTIPLRLMNGDSLVEDEWHLTQFASLFSYLPTLLWVKLTGSTEGIVFFSRVLYVAIQAGITVVIYRFFREYKLWAVAAAFLYLTQFVNIMWQISYHSMFVALLLFMGLTLASIYKKSSKRLYIILGACYGACCVCNPAFCFAVVVYLIFFALWKFRSQIEQALVRLKMKAAELKSNLSAKKMARKGKGKKARYKQHIEAQKNKQRTNTGSHLAKDSFGCFFTREAVTYMCVGVLIVAIIAVIFFFATGGSITSLLANVSNILTYSDYAERGGLLVKFAEVLYVFNELSFGTPFLLPLLLLALIFDKKRAENSHRVIYVLLALALAVMYSVSAFQKASEDIYFLEFPFFIFSTICYVVTKNKNKVLFCCMWIPCVIGMLFHLFASGSLLSAANVTLIASNTAGMIFIAALFKELVAEQRASEKKGKIILVVASGLLCVSLCLQVCAHMAFYQVALYKGDENHVASVGPYKNLSMTEEKYKNYMASIADLDLIKESTDEDDNIYITSYRNWMYLYLERSVGAHSTYYLSSPFRHTLQAYYGANPEHIPDYVYVPYIDCFNSEFYDNSIESITTVLSDIFDYTVEELPNGLLFKITEYKAPTE